MNARLLIGVWAWVAWLLATPASAQNLLANPDFQAGNTGFTSQYTYVAPPGTDPGAGSYTIGPDNRAYNSGFLASYGDHTTGTGNYMIVNGALTPLTIWEQTVTGLQANTTYQFSFWLLNTFPTSKAIIQVSANGVDVGPSFTNPNDGGNWQLNRVSVNTGASTQLTLRLRNLNLDSNGNDLGIDDVALTAPTVNPQLTANNVTTAAISTAALPTQISPLSASITGPTGATVASFTVVTVPSVGTLRLGSGGPVVAAGQVIGAAQAGQLYYTPAGSTSQTVTFTYTATDSNGNFSANTATYSIPLVAATPPTGCGPAYGGGPASSGLSADYYAGYFADNLSFFGNAPGLTRLDPVLNFTGNGASSWGDLSAVATGSSANWDTYSARYRGSVSIPTAGSYTFYLTSDDASYLWLDGGALAPTLANAAINNGGLHGPQERTVTVTLSAGLHNILVYYGEQGGGNTLTLEYSSAGISRQIIPNSALCAGPSPLPPVATNVTNSPAMPSTNPATAIAPLAGSDPNAGGSVTSFRIGALPATTQGLLYLGTVEVVAGQVLTAADAANLSFDPEPTFSGNATFTFFAINNAGIASNLPATYTIPVVGPVADVTTTLSGPTTLGAGVSSGTYTVTYTNNGPQAAQQVTQVVRLPTGATLSAAQLAALPSTASYNAGTNTINFGTVPVLNAGATNTFTFSFTSPSSQGSNSLTSTVGTAISQGANTAPDQATVNVTVTTGNFFVTNDDSNEVPGNTTKTGNIILNDANPSNLDNSAFAAQVVTPPTNGTLVFNADGSYSYTPNNGYLGPDTFTYRVRVPNTSPEFSNVSTVALNVYDASQVCGIGTGTNLLVNPSFTAGNTGFTSTYTYVTQTGNGLVPEATYTVADNAANYHPMFAGTGRNGAGDNFMIVNGSQNLSVVYQQTVTVRPNTYYSFSGFANSVNPGSPAQLGFVINGRSTSSVTTLDGTTNYIRIADLWFSGNSTSAVIEIRDVNKAFGGNDFGLDDLYFGTCTIGLVANDVTAPAMSNAAPQTPIPSLSATVTAGPAVGSFTIRTVPDAASGILYFNNVPVVPGQVIDLADAGSLRFDPAPAFVGTAIFTYSATDVSGAGSNNTATYRVPVDSRPLPVTLSRFEAEAVRHDAALSWTTATELNNDRFEVERSTNGREFARIVTVRGQGTKNTPTTYAYTDAGIGSRAGVAYYRLRQIDTDGTTSFSPVLTVRFGKAAAAAISLWPNPATQLTNLDLRELAAGRYQVRVLDNVGREVLAGSYEAGATHPLDLRHLANGTYVVLVRAADGQQLAKRLVKE